MAVDGLRPGLLADTHPPITTTAAAARAGGGYLAGDADGAYRSYASGSSSEGQWYADGVRSNAASEPWLPIPLP